MSTITKYDGNIFFGTSYQQTSGAWTNLSLITGCIVVKFNMSADEVNQIDSAFGINYSIDLYDSDGGGFFENYSIFDNIFNFSRFENTVPILHNNLQYDKTYFDFFAKLNYVDILSATEAYTCVLSIGNEYNDKYIGYDATNGYSGKFITPYIFGTLSERVFIVNLGCDIYVGDEFAYNVRIELIRYTAGRVIVRVHKELISGTEAQRKTAVYNSSTPTQDTYQCTVVNGSGSGEYAENATVEITADEPEAGYEFDTWEADHSLTFVQGSYTSAHALFVMPASAVTITALYKQKSDPFGPGGTSEPGGGGGTFDDTSDNIEDSSLPTLSVADTGFTTIYNPTLAQLQSLADYMWTSDSFLETIVNHAKQLLENPINAVIALNIVPCPVPDGGSQEVKVLFVPTGVTMTKAANQFVDVDCGTVRLDEYYGSAMDYSPLTEITCYLPYIGQVTLDTDEVMGNTLQVKYRIDIVTGMCVAKIFVSGNLLYQFSGHCAINMPITSADFSSYIGAIIQAAKLVGGAIAAGAGGAAAMATTDVPEATTTPALQPSPNAQPIAGTPEATESTPSKFGEVAKKTVMNTVDAVMGSKTVIEHSGGFSGNSGYLAVRRPYLIIKRPRMCNPNEYGAYNGYPSMMYLNLGSCSGYTEVQEIQLTGLSATNPELSEIAQLLKAGVIL